MGVTGLWTLIAETKERISLREMGNTARQGKRKIIFALDVSTWLVAAQMIPHTVKDKKPYLRYLYQRLSKFIRYGSQVVLVLDGVSPALKKTQRSKTEQGTFKRMCREVTI